MTALVVPLGHTRVHPTGPTPDGISLGIQWNTMGQLEGPQPAQLLVVHDCQVVHYR